MKVTIPQKLREMLLKTTVPAYCHPLGAIYPQAAYITLDLRDGALDISTALDGGLQTIDEYQGRVRCIPISPYAHGPSLLAKLENLLPELQAYADLFVLRWDGSNMRYSQREDLWSALHEEGREHLVALLKDMPEVVVLTPDLYNVRDLLREKPTSSPQEIAREIVDEFQHDFPFNYCDEGAVEKTVKDTLQKRVSEEAAYAAIVFDGGGGVTLDLGENFKHHYDCAKQAAEDYLRYIIDGTTDGWDGHEEHLNSENRDGVDWFRGDRAEQIAQSGEEIFCGETASEFFEILRHARGMEGRRRRDSERMTHGER